MRTSPEFHTITLSMFLLDGETWQLAKDFEKFSQKERCIQMYPRNVWGEKFNMCSNIINVTINPKILADTHNYITVATYQDMETAIANFNKI